ncbi:MAG TPA: phenylalanine--tRNA ligase subunit beta [Vicinamibacteria bacterium]|nr:phenylalanine--tRNA ligase subunit beta [Vicinamibacteria bacterium]
MKIPLSWLKEFVDVPVEPAQLGDDLTMVGLACEGIETDGRDTVLDLDITTNRVDCMNVYGVAREVSVIYGKPLRPPDTAVVEKGAAAASALSVRIEAPDLCPRFCGRVLDVTMGPSPAWMRDRLELAGVRPISNVVDLTNYVMLELGQPSHAFDLAKIEGGALVIRLSREGERLVTLDGVERALPVGTGVVSSTTVPLALAGIMGGASSEVSDATTTVALEAAYWHPLTIRRSAKALGMHTEASHRFERGADPEGQPAALDRLVHLLVKTGAGSARPGIVDQVAKPRRAARVPLRPSRANALLGVDVPDERQRLILLGLGFVLAPDGWQVPSWRSDVAREVDLVEEVGRHYGAGRIPSTVPAARRVGALTSAQRQERELRRLLVGTGLQEVVQLSLAPPSEGRVALANPLAGGGGALRDSLVFPGLLDALTTNIRQGRRDVSLFEIGRVFTQDGGGMREAGRVGFVWSGSAEPPGWARKARLADFFDGKGALEAVVARLAAGRLSWQAAADRAELHPGKSVRLEVDGRAAGYLGVLHPDQAEALGVRGEVVVAELELQALTAGHPSAVRAQPLDRFPAVARDLSVFADSGVAAEALLAEVRGAAGPHLRDVAVADRYEGAPVPAGRVSLTLALRFQAGERTLTGDEVERAMADVVGRLRASGHEIRGEERAG